MADDPSTLPLLPASRTPFKQPNTVSLWRVSLVMLLVVGPVVLLADVELPSWEVPNPWRPPYADEESNLCPQVKPLFPLHGPHADLARNVSRRYDTPEFVETAAGWLGGAVQIATQSFDKMGPVEEDERWKVFDGFHEYLEETFPSVHSHLGLTKVNTYGLLYTWKGKDESLKPLLLMGHQDTVPVDPRTIDQWTHPPWSGLYDGEWIWGRGSVDDKSGVIGILSAVETLLDHGFQPTRTVVLSFGFDEEVSGVRSASSLAKYLLEKYGEDAFALLVDEGGGLVDNYGATFAAPAIGEKGSFDVKIEIFTQGGHSSIPPPHTGIGLLSKFLVNIEEHAVVPELARGTPIYETIKCFGQHAPDISESLRRSIQRSTTSNRALRNVEKQVFQDLAIRSIAGTTQAIDLIQGGVKANALPELSWAVVNNRIATDSSVSDVKARYSDLIAPLAAAANLTLDAFGAEVVGTGSAGKVVLSDAWGTALEPAPVTPTDSKAKPYRLLSGTILAIEGDSKSTTDGEEKKPIFVAPSIMSGNTDTRYYWKLTKHIYRYSHVHANDARGIHTVNESIRATAFAKLIKFIAVLILNADESKEL